MPTAPTLYSPFAIVRAAVAVITVRGKFQPVKRQWDTGQAPTATEVTEYLNGRHPEAKRFDAVTGTDATATAVLKWCGEGSEYQNDVYRTALAQVAKAHHVGRGQAFNLLVSAVSAWERDQAYEGRKTAMRLARTHSRPQGDEKERITRTLTVQAVVPVKPKKYGYRVQPRTLIRFVDDNHNVYIWAATAASLPTLGQRVWLTGTVKSHGQKLGIHQTTLTNCTWKPTT